ncbi:hypothetical protein FGB62_204g10 [Gracilaria domingensis]|nr:hypothetical protein FGB62_204g10 [Gracilaria domingensis]
MWALVASKFDARSKATTRPLRDETLKNKYDKLCISKRKTEDPSCPPDLRRAKHIARDIQAKVVAIVLDHDEESDEENSDAVTECGRKKEEEGDANKLGFKCNKRNVGFAGLASRKPKTEDVLEEKVDTMTRFIGMIAESMKSANAYAGTLNEQNAVNIGLQEVQSVKEEVMKDIEEAKSMISGMIFVLL